MLGAARKAVDDMTPGTEPGATETPILARKDAALVVVLLGDADDQTTGYTTTAGETEPDHCSGPLLGCKEAGDQCVCKPNCGDVCGTSARCDMTSCQCRPILN